MRIIYFKTPEQRKKFHRKCTVCNKGLDVRVDLTFNMGADDYLCPDCYKEVEHASYY